MNSWVFIIHPFTPFSTVTCEIRVGKDALLGSLILIREVRQIRSIWSLSETRAVLIFCQERSWFVCLLMLELSQQFQASFWEPSQNSEHDNETFNFRQGEEDLLHLVQKSTGNEQAEYLGRGREMKGGFMYWGGMAHAEVCLCVCVGQVI